METRPTGRLATCVMLRNRIMETWHRLDDLTGTGQTRAGEPRLYDLFSCFTPSLLHELSENLGGKDVEN